MFVDRSDTASIEAAVEAGVSAYIVDGLKKERVKPILDMAVSRFNAFSRLQRELADAVGAGGTQDGRTCQRHSHENAQPVRRRRFCTVATVRDEREEKKYQTSHKV